MKNEVKLIEFVRLLKNIEKLYSKNLGNNPELVKFLKQFTSILETYKSYSTEEFLTILRSLKASKIPNKKNKKILDNIDIQKLSFFDLRKLLENPAISKEELLELGEKKLGISKGANKRLNKEQLKELIESAIKNVETLDVIKHKASE